MNILFLHPGFPGQFKLLAQFFGKNKENKIIFVTMETARKEFQISGVKKIIIAQKSEQKDQGDVALKSPPGLPVANLLVNLKKQDFTPDIIIGQAGSGMSFYVKDVFPQTPFLCFFDWYHRLGEFQESESNFEQELKTRINFRNKNMLILADLVACDMGICSTNWQKTQFPNQFHENLNIIPEGIDTQLCKPLPETVFKTDDLDLSHVRQLVTYTANLLAPYRGFEQFMESLPSVLELKPDAHVVILGADRISITDSDGNKKSYKTTILEKIPLDMDRVHFIDTLPYERCIMLLQASAVHVYLDSPLVVSRSLLEAMSCECMVIAPDIPPVHEVIKDGKNGIIADFSSPEKICEKIVACLDYPSFMKSAKQKARQTILEQYNLEKSVSLQLDIVKKMIQSDNKNKTDMFG